MKNVAAAEWLRKKWTRGGNKKYVWRIFRVPRGGNKKDVLRMSLWFQSEVDLAGNLHIAQERFI